MNLFAISSHQKGAFRACASILNDVRPSAVETRVASGRPPENTVRAKESGLGEVRAIGLGRHSAS
jgi:hypothetical protein